MVSVLRKSKLVPVPAEFILPVKPAPKKVISSALFVCILPLALKDINCLKLLFVPLVLYIGCVKEIAVNELPVSNILSLLKSPVPYFLAIVECLPDTFLNV